jgi:hypothetical protein
VVRTFSSLLLPPIYVQVPVQEDNRRWNINGEKDELENESEFRESAASMVPITEDQRHGTIIGLWPDRMIVYILLKNAYANRIGLENLGQHHKPIGCNGFLVPDGHQVHGPKRPQK